MVTGMSPIPSQRKSWPNVYRWVPEIGSSPIVASQRPRPPAIRPGRSASPLSAATKVMPRTVSMKNSGDPKASTSGRTSGMASPRTSAPKTAPTSELIMAAPRARPASPRLAIACPSTIVAAEVGSPGMPNRIDVMSPVVLVTESMPRRNANASTGVILNTKGSMRASVVGPPRPGRIPTVNPMATPISIRPNVGHAKTWISPVRLAWARSAIGGASGARRSGQPSRGSRRLSAPHAPGRRVHASQVHSLRLRDGLRAARVSPTQEAC